MRSEPDYAALAPRIKAWGRELGFQQVGIARADLPEDEARLFAWLDRGFHGEMGYMARHGAARARPAELVPGTLRVISVRLDYLPEAAEMDTISRWPTSRATRSGATTTRSCASGSSVWRGKLPP